MDSPVVERHVRRLNPPYHANKAEARNTVSTRVLPIIMPSTSSHTQLQSRHRQDEVDDKITVVPETQVTPEDFASYRLRDAAIECRISLVAARAFSVTLEEDDNENGLREEDETVSKKMTLREKRTRSRRRTRWK